MLEEATRKCRGKLNAVATRDETKTRPRLLSWEAQRMKLLLTEKVKMWLGAPVVAVTKQLLFSTTENLCLGRKQHMRKTNTHLENLFAPTLSDLALQLSHLPVFMNSFPSVVLRPKFWYFPIFNLPCLLRRKPVENSRITFSIKNPESCNFW